MKPHDQFSLFLSGPAVVLFLSACLALVALLAIAAGRLDGLAAFGQRASGRLKRWNPLSALWGIAGAVLLVAASAALGHFKPLALLVPLVAFGLLGIGTGVAALALGRELLGAFGSLDGDLLPRLRLGLTVLVLAAVVPFLGWLVVLLFVASGLGAVIECLLVRRSE